MPSKRENKEVENIVVEEDSVEIAPIDTEPLDDEGNGGEGVEDVVDDDNSSVDDEGDEDEGDFGVEKDEDDEEDENEHPVGDDEEDDDDDEDDEEDEGELDEDDEGPSASKKQKGGAGKAKGKKATKAVSQPDDEETIQYGIDSDDDEDVEFEKFEEDTREQYLLNFHPESRAVNFDEVKSLCTVIRDSDGDIIDDFHTTIPILTKYEKARILGLRAKQLNSNIKPMIPVPDYVIDSYRIAELELEAKAIPFIIKRPLPDGRNEYWRAQDLTCVY